jgi:hypothetical protein
MAGVSKIHWLEPIDGKFDIATDWAGGSIPGPSDDAVLNAAGSAFTVTVNTSESVHSIALAANARLAITRGTFTAAAGTGLSVNAGTISVGSDARLFVGGGLLGPGTIDLNATGRSAVLGIVGAGVTLGGGGTLSLGANGDDQIRSYTEGTASLTNVNDTIAGAGFIAGASGANILDVDNQARGVIDATSPTDVLRVGDGSGFQSAGMIVNVGLLEGTGAAGLILRQRRRGHSRGRRLFRDASGGYRRWNARHVGFRRRPRPIRDTRRVGVAGDDRWNRAICYFSEPGARGDRQRRDA